MSKLIDMMGFVSGKLTVTSRSTTKGPTWECTCQCGKTVRVFGHHLRRGLIKSCGCLNRQPITGPTNYRHGHTANRKPTRTFQSWCNMIQRCTNPNASMYHMYGARGVTVCKRWRADFRNFLADMGECPNGRTLDRYPNFAGNYEPGNCRWATPKQQANNTRRTHRITFNGRTRTLAGWATHLGVKASTVLYRLKHWPIEQALSLYGNSNQPNH